MDSRSYTFAYNPPTIRHGAGAVASLGEELAGAGDDRALVLTGASVGATPAVMDPVREGLGDRLAGVFDGASAGKTLGTAAEAARRAVETDADAVVAVGGGRSIDLAKVTSALASHDRPVDDVVADVLAEGRMLVPEGDLLDVAAVPTTLPGADLSQVAGVTLSTDPDPPADAPGGGVSDARLMPVAVVHDVDLAATTPPTVLRRSAMNGFNKGVEMLYTRHRTPVTDAAAMRGLRLLQGSLPAATADDPDREALDTALQGVALTQYGVSTARAYRASIVHAFGHALSAAYPIQQGVAHAVATPHVLRYVFDRVDGRRDLLAEALGVDDGEAADADETAAAVVDAVTETRDALDLPSRLRAVEGADREDFPDLARAVLDDSFMRNTPAGLDATQADIEGVLDAMW